MKNGGTRENPDIVGAGPNDVHVSVGFFWTQNMFWSENILRFGLPLNFGFEVNREYEIKHMDSNDPFLFVYFCLRITYSGRNVVVVA